MTFFIDLGKFFPQKMLKIRQAFLRFFSKKNFQSLATHHFKHLKVKRFGYRRPVSSDFEKMVSLQNKNLVSSVKQSEQSNGFLSAAFSAQQFHDMDNDLCVIICTDIEKMIGYACASSAEYNKNTPLIATMLQHFTTMTYKHKSLTTYHFFIYGPVCIDKEYRGKGILYNLFEKMLGVLTQEHQQLELLTTLISIENKRSINAHTKLGMEIVGQFEFNQKTFLVLAFPIREFLENKRNPHG